MEVAQALLRAVVEAKASRQTVAATASVLSGRLAGVPAAESDVITEEVRPYLTKKVAGANPTSGQTAYRNRGLHVDPGGGADALPKTPAEAKRGQRGGRRRRGPSPNTEVDGSTLNGDQNEVKQDGMKMCSPKHSVFGSEANSERDAFENIRAQQEKSEGFKMCLTSSFGECLYDQSTRTEDLVPAWARSKQRPFRA